MHITIEVKRTPKVFYKYAKGNFKTVTGVADLGKSNGGKPMTAQEK